MSHAAHNLIKAALQWEEARERHAKKPSSERLNEEFLAQLMLLAAIREFRGEEE